MNFAYFLPIFVLFPLGWCSQVSSCQCHQPVINKEHGLEATRRQTRHVQHHRSTRRHRIRGSKTRSEDFPPRIIEHPSDLFVKKDKPATLYCRAEGNPQPTIEWYRNGEHVETSTDDKTQRSYVQLPEGPLFFFSLNQRKGKSDEGIYTCVARNHLGTAFSRNASLYVAALRDDFRLNPSDAVVAVGKQLEIECLPPKGHPEPNVTWKKDGIPINHNNSRYTISAGKLFIGKALKTDSGLYSCLASNQVGERESRAAKIVVLEKPMFTYKPSDVTAKFGSTVQFGCGAQGDPKPTFHWSKENGDLPQGRYEITNENTLRIRSVTLYDSGKYICTAGNQLETVSAKALLTVQDPLDTGQIEKERQIYRELMGVRVHLDNITALPSASVYVHWQVLTESPFTEGYSVFYRTLSSTESEWTEWTKSRINEYSTVIPSLWRGQKYEFKIRPFAGKNYGPDSNIKHLRIPEEVPNIAPQNINVTAVEGGNGTIVVSWEPPPKNIHSSNIKGYKVWCFENETHPKADWIVDEETKSLEIPMLASGIKYQVQVAAINDAGIGMPSIPKYIMIDSPEVKEVKDENIYFELILQVVRHPAFIGTVGTVAWILLMVAAVYVCQRHSKRYSTKQHSILGNSLYRFASEDTIIKHRMDISDSPWLSHTWKSASCSRNYSSTISMNSQLLWSETKDTADFHKSTMSFERKSEGSRSQIIPLVPDSNSLYGTMYVDLPGKDMTTFQRLPSDKSQGMGRHFKTPDPLGLLHHRPLPSYLNDFSGSNDMNGGTRSKLPWQPNINNNPDISFKDSWSKNCKKELQHANSAPLSPYCQAPKQGDSVPSIQHLNIKKVGKGDYAKVMKTFSSPKILHYTTSLQVMDLLPYTPSLPPPPVPPPDENPIHNDKDKIGCSVSSYSVRNQEKQGHKINSKKKSPPDTLNIKPASECFPINDDGDNVLTPEDVAQYLELSDQGQNTRHKSEYDASLPRPFSPSQTYGYICSPIPSEADVVDEDDDLDLEDIGSLKSYRKYCETPTSSISEYESSMAGSLVNGWGSVSEDNYTSARCSMVSSSDGSFLMDANFAKALAVAVDSFCFGGSQTETAGRDTFYADLSPSVSPLDGILNQHSGENTDVTKKKSRVNHLPVLDWNIDWMDEMEAKYSRKNDMKHHFPFDKKMDPFK
ncbi:roundabout homolog 4 isoform X2 [Xenopus tropicalis]|uniref:Roundabout homolog 4 isoform X2 n=2 Tax=Xenopus tropicalis TaxID=8364 RepID=A0A8J0SRE8_XENTR|nr:roundabout homolog 4 isoform X2 [Xenopus tropicalis]